MKDRRNIFEARTWRRELAAELIGLAGRLAPSEGNDMTLSFTRDNERDYRMSILTGGEGNDFGVRGISFSHNGVPDSQFKSREGIVEFLARGLTQIYDKGVVNAAIRKTVKNDFHGYNVDFDGIVPLHNLGFILMSHWPKEEDEKVIGVMNIEDVKLFEAKTDILKLSDLLGYANCLRDGKVFIDIKGNSTRKRKKAPRMAIVLSKDLGILKDRQWVGDLPYVVSGAYIPKTILEDSDLKYGEVGIVSEGIRSLGNEVIVRAYNYTKYSRNDGFYEAPLRMKLGEFLMEFKRINDEANRQ